MLNYYFKLKSPDIIGKIKLNNYIRSEKLNDDFNFKIIKKNIIFYSKQKIIKNDNKSDFDIEDNIYDDEHDEDESEEEEFLEEDEIVNEDIENYNHTFNKIDKYLINEDNGIANEIKENKINNDEGEKKEMKAISKKRKYSNNQFEDNIMEKKKKID